MPPILSPLPLSLPLRQELERWLRAPALPEQVRVRGLILLAAAEGHSDSAIATELKVNRKTVSLWRKRFTREGLAVIWAVAPGRGRKPLYGPHRVQSLVETARPTQPHGRTPWTCRELAASQGISKSTVSTILENHNIAAYGSRAFPRFRKPALPQSLTAVVGLYVNPPQKAIILCGEKTRPGPDRPLPQPNWRPEEEEEEDSDLIEDEHLILGLDLLLHSVAGQRYQWQRDQELLRFLRRLDREFASSLPLHLILDVYGTRKPPRLQGWLKRNPRCAADFVAPGCCWLDRVNRSLVERSAAGLNLDSVNAVSEAILQFLQGRSLEPFVWTASVNSLLEGSR